MVGNLKLKVSYNNLELELEGEENSVRDLFESVRKEGLGSLIKFANGSVNTIKQDNITNNEVPMVEGITIDDTPSSDYKYPSLIDVVMKQLPKTEPEWVLTYCFFASNYGKDFFTRSDILSLYDTSKRATDQRKKNLTINIQSLFKNNYLCAINDQEFSISEEGIKYSELILSGKNNDRQSRKPASKTGKKGQVDKNEVLTNNKVQKRETYKIVDLGLTENDRLKMREYYDSVKPQNQNSQVLLLCYWLKENKDLVSFDENIVFTALRTVDEKIPKVLSQVLRNIKNDDRFIKNQDGTYSLNHIGEDFVKYKLLIGANV